MRIFNKIFKRPLTRETFECALIGHDWSYEVAPWRVKYVFVRKCGRCGKKERFEPDQIMDLQEELRQGGKLQIKNPFDISGIVILCGSILLVILCFL